MKENTSFENIKNIRHVDFSDFIEWFEWFWLFLVSIGNSSWQPILMTSNETINIKKQGSNDKSYLCFIWNITIICCFNVKKAVLMVLTVPHSHLNKLNFFYTHRQLYWHIIHNCTLKIKVVFYYENFWYEYFYIQLLSVLHVSYKYVGPSSAGLDFFNNFFHIS